MERLKDKTTGAVSDRGKIIFREISDILITEKDAVKCAQIETLKNDPRLWVVPVTARIDAALAQQIVEKCRGCSPA